MTSKQLTIFILLLLTLVLSSGASAEYSRNSINPAPALAPIGTSFTYQGYLTEADNPAKGTYDFQFMLYDDVSTGIQVGSTVTKNDVTVAEGIFMVNLDFGDFFNGTAYWLEIWVRLGASTGGYQQLLPRQPLTTVPYASYAANAPWSGLSGVPAGFADGVDNDSIKVVSGTKAHTETAYPAGVGYTASISVDTGYTLTSGLATGCQTNLAGVPTGVVWVETTVNGTNLQFRVFDSGADRLPGNRRPVTER